MNITERNFTSRFKRVCWIRFYPYGILVSALSCYLVKEKSRYMWKGLILSHKTTYINSCIVHVTVDKLGGITPLGMICPLGFCACVKEKITVERCLSRWPRVISTLRATALLWNLRDSRKVPQTAVNGVNINYIFYRP